MVNVASGLKSFVKAVEARSEVKALVETSFEAVGPVLGRIDELLEAVHDEKTENPRDAALAAYLIVLGRLAPDQAQGAREKTRGRADLWWARQVANEVGPRPQDNSP